MIQWVGVHREGKEVYSRRLQIVYIIGGWSSATELLWGPGMIRATSYY